MMNDPARVQQLRYVASRLSMTFSEEDTYGLTELLADFELFRSGKHHNISNVLRSELSLGDIDLRIFDLEFTKGKKRKHQQTVFFIRSKDLSLPQMLMKPESVFHKIGQLLGIDDIDFEEHPEFSKQYWLKGEDEELVRDIMGERVLKFFTIEKGWYVEGLGYYLIVYKKYQLLGPRNLTNFYQKGMDIYNLLKAEWQF